MARMKTGGVVAALAFVALVVGGCCDKENQKIKDLQADNGKLSSQNAELRSQIAQANAREADSLRDRDAELARKDADIATLRSQLGAKVVAPPSNVAPGWEQGIMGDRVTIATDILFESGKAALTAGGKAKLDKIVSDIKTHYGSKPLRVYGHTDTDPIKYSGWDDNLDLSAGRAMSVTRYLISKGLSPKQIETVAMGEWHPEAADKAKNRRVEIYVIKVAGAAEKAPAAEKAATPAEK